MRSLPDSEMGDLVPHGGVHSDKTTDEKKQMERQLEEDEGAESRSHAGGNEETQRLSD